MSAGWTAWSGHGNSRACPDTRAAAVCEGGGDFRDLISRAQDIGAALLVRAGRGTQRRVAPAPGGDADLRDHVPGTDPVGRRTIAVPACGGPDRGKGRTAKLTLRCTPVDLMPPKDRAGEPPLCMIAVSALEERPPRRPALPASKTGKKNQPLHRMLPTTGGQGDLRKCLAFDAITAFRVRDLSLPARERPDDMSPQTTSGHSVPLPHTMASRSPGDRRR